MPKFRSDVAVDGTTNLNGNLNALGNTNQVGHADGGSGASNTTLAGDSQIGQSLADETAVVATKTQEGPLGNIYVNRQRPHTVGNANYVTNPASIFDVVFMNPTTPGREFTLTLDPAFEGHLLWIVNAGSQALSIGDSALNHYGNLPAGQSALYLCRDIGCDLVAVCLLALV